MSNTANLTLICYMPVVHQGYLNLINKYDQISEILLIDRSLLTEKFPELAKDIRAVEAEKIASMLQLLVPVTVQVRVISALAELQKIATNSELILPEDEISDWLVTEYLANHKYQIVTDHFLRWNKKKSIAQTELEDLPTVTADHFSQLISQQIDIEIDHSPDWWRQVSALLIKDGKLVLSSHNHAAPHSMQQYSDGDPRGNFHQGEQIDKSLAVHAEQEIFARAAKEGIVTQGCEFYCSTFPCPYCARLIALSGVTKFYFRDGYSMVDGLELMQAYGIEVIKVV